MLNWSSSSQRWLSAIAVVTGLALTGTSLMAQGAQPPQEPPAHWGPVSINMEDVPYPHPVQYLPLNRFGQDMRLAYMDVAPAGAANGQTAVLLHGMNFYGEAFTPTIEALRNAGFRVVVVDQIGYGRSSKPIVPYDLNFKVSNTRALLDHLGIDRAAIVGHSMGGMVASRFALVYPDVTSHVVMVNQIGMTDQRRSRPWRDTQEVYQGVLNGTTYQSVLRGHMIYYHEWKPEYLEYVRRQYGWTLSGDWPRMAMIRALQQQVLYEDPVAYDWQHISTKGLVIGGRDDNLTPGYAQLARGVSESLQNATLILYPGIGHNPHFDHPEQFHGDLIRFLRSDPDEPASAFR
jgi:pimeloyl-ACP methyl ester carboxylesterase